jgi:fermentation-respiration switch protein FrsA (DUF1100 family)
MKKLLITLMCIFVAYSFVYAQDLIPGKNKVTYLSDGEKISAFLFLPEDYVEGQKRAAIVITPPNTGVKEQTAGLYAKKLSQKGFITLVFDPRGFGESEGHPLLLDPYRQAEDVRNSVSYVRTLKQVDKDNVFNMGMCAGAGISPFATAFDSRIKAQVMVSPYLTAADNWLQAFGGAANLRATMMPGESAARDTYFATGEDIMMKMVPETDEEIKTSQPIAIGMREYYLPGMPGDVPNWKNEVSLVSVSAVLSFSVFNYAHMFESIPVYVVYGDKAVSADGAIKFYDMLNGPKERLVVEGAGHFDLYWMPQYVDPAVEGISAFLGKYVQ